MVPKIGHALRRTRLRIVGVRHRLQRVGGHVVQVQMPLSERNGELLILELVLVGRRLRQGHVVRVGENERKHGHALHGDECDEENAVACQARVANAAVEARRGAQREEYKQDGKHRARAQRVEVERNLLIERDARHLNCADVRKVRHVHLDGMALASGV